VLMEQRSKRSEYIEQSVNLAAADKQPGGKPEKPRMTAERAAQELQTFALSQFVEFPSKDGFTISLDMTVEFELMPENLSKIYLLYGDLPQVVEKIILPQVLSVSRLKGSSYRAQDFIMGEGRETFQNDLSRDLGRTLAARSIVVHNAIIRNVDIPLNILTPNRAVSLAKEQNLTNKSLQNTARKLAELNVETELIEQRRSEVGQETAKLVARIAAERDQAIAQLQAETQLQVAELELKKSEILARIAQLKGETDVKVNFLIDNEKAQGEQLRAEALGGNNTLADLRLVEALNPKVKTQIIYAGTGTLWTDLKSGALTLPSGK